jgi:hypothetical protein
MPIIGAGVIGDPYRIRRDRRRMVCAQGAGRRRLLPG